MEKYVLINVVGKPVKSRIVCYFTKRNIDDVLELWRIVENYYRHPEAPNDALLQKTEEEFVMPTEKHFHYLGGFAPIFHLEMIQDTAKLIYGR